MERSPGTLTTKGPRDVSPASDKFFMGHALRLARRRTGSTYPNPCVGAVLVKRGQVLAAASSAATGGDHAEVRVLARAGSAAKGSTLFVTLEPCAHFGRTPPCVGAIRAAGVRTVVVGIRDPALHVRGRGIAALRRAGIVVREVSTGEAEAVHAHYLHHLRAGLPWVTLKIASSIDGRIATAAGDSKWITGEPARRHAHRLRAEHHAIAVGAATVALDDPGLDVRMARGVNPTPVIFDTRLALFSGRRGTGALPRLARSGSIFVYTSLASRAAIRRLTACGAEGIEVPRTEHSHVSISEALKALGARDFRSLLVEGGGRLLGAFVGEQQWQRIYHYQAPLLLGDGRPLLSGVSWPDVVSAPRLRVLARKALGEDQLTVLERRL